MGSQQSVNVAQLVDERPVSAFHVILVGFSFLIVLSDGYDITAIAFAAPHLIREWAITDRSALGPVFSASLFGILVGSPLFGYVGDRYGRKAATIASCVTFGVFTLAAAWSSSLAEMLWLRALAGLGLGGLMPNMIALTGEYAPRRYRATLIILMFCGVTLGGAVPGAIANWLVPTYGWRIIFLVGGVLPIVLAVCAAVWLPESAKFLVLKNDRARTVAMLARLAPDVPIGPDTQLVVPQEKAYAGFSPADLFRDGMALITPLLWLCFAVNLMGFYFLISWMPTLLTGQKILAPGDAATAYSWTALMVMVFLAGFCVLGLQFGLNAASAMIYPTAFRSNGSGWAFGVGRFGSILGPILGGYLIAMQLSLDKLFLLAAIPFAVGAVACLVLARLYARTFKADGLGERQIGAAAR
jgi:AAHS family 4-hydroxybenzoate transporter-like MFS transporter